MNGPFKSATAPKLETEIWSVVVLYEDVETRTQAMELCDRIMKRFWPEVEFDFRWWRTDFLGETPLALSAQKDALEADILIFSGCPESPLSLVLLEWFDAWVDRRSRSEGILFDLTPAAALHARLVQERQAHLQRIAAQAGMDYFNRVPPAFGKPNLESTAELQARASQMTGLLDDILTHVPPPSHVGLNE